MESHDVVGTICVFIVEDDVEGIVSPYLRRRHLRRRFFLGHCHLRQPLLIRRPDVRVRRR